MSGPTPGPWFRDGTSVFALSEDGVNRFSASVQGGWVVTGRQRTDAEELEATARLLEAAPELLKALIESRKRIIELCSAYSNPLPVASLERIDAAIAKATGAQP